MRRAARHALRGLVGPRLLDVARDGVRQYGQLTAGARVDPDFLLIGAKRGGTTSLYRYLAQHPDVLPLFPSPRLMPLREETKGVHYFDANYFRGRSWYRSHFPAAAYRAALEMRRGRRTVVGDGSPYYLFHPLAAQRAAGDVPHAKILVLLRNPADRAYSHWKERRREGAEPLSFVDALAAEPERLAGEEARILTEPGYHSTAHEDQSYLSQSRYLEPLQRWLAVFPREQFCLLASEDLYCDPQAAMDRVTAFLDLEPYRLGDARPWNEAVGDQLPIEVRAQLDERVADHNRQLANECGLDLPWAPAPTMS